MSLVVLATGVSGCFGAGEWKDVKFEAAHLEFQVPSGWSVKMGAPGVAPVAVEAGKTTSALDNPSDGAVMTALSVLEDAALVVVATQQVIDARWFAKRVGEFIPLDRISFDQHAEPYTRNGISGFAGEGSGYLPSDGSPVYFRTLVVDVAGKSVLITLYAEEDERSRYELVFDRILGSMRPTADAPVTTPALEDESQTEDDAEPNKDEATEKDEVGQDDKTADSDEEDVEDEGTNGDAADEDDAGTSGGAGEESPEEGSGDQPRDESPNEPAANEDKGTAEEESDNDPTPTESDDQGETETDTDDDVPAANDDAPPAEGKAEDKPVEATPANDDEPVDEEAEAPEADAG